jgi:HSP20 family protein
MGNMGNWSHETEWRWGLDMDDREDKVVVRAEAPGFEKEDFDVQVNDNQLVMKARHQQELKEDAARQWHQEELFRTITLPRGIDPERVEAQYRNGVLTVTIPKTEQRKGQKIQIKS